MSSSVHHSAKGTRRESTNLALAVSRVLDWAHAGVGKGVGVAVERGAKASMVHSTDGVERLRVEGET